MEYILVEALDSVSDEVILPYVNIEPDDVSTSKLSEPNESTTICHQAAISLSDRIGNEKINDAFTMPISKIDGKPNLLTPRLLTHDLAIKEVRSKRTNHICCNYCQKSFPSHSKMIWHRRMHESDRPRFNCPFDGCNRTYLSPQSCELHYKQTHCSRADFQLFECKLCDKTFAIAQTLEVHMRYHTRQFPFECSHCGRRFGQKSHMTSHIQVKHNNCRYICPETGCGKMFKNTISLRNHSYSHTGMPFRCVYCDRGYPQKSRLKVHLKLKHEITLSLEELESMRKLKCDRTRHSFIKLDVVPESQVSVGSAGNGPLSNPYFEDVVEEIEVHV